jgi:hypothetical protein
VGRRPSAARNSITKDMLEELYVKRGLSINQAARSLGIGYWLVWKLLKEYGIPTRPSGFQKGHRPWHKGRRLPFMPRRARVHPRLEPTPELALALGALLGDGWVGVRRGRRKEYIIKYSSKERGFCELVASALRKIGLSPYVKEARSGRSALFNTLAYSKAFYEWFSRLGAEEIEEVALRYPREFVGGLYMAEGKKFRDARKLVSSNITIYNARLDILEAARRAVEALGYRADIHDYRHLDGTYHLHVHRSSPEEGLRFLNEIGIAKITGLQV